MNLNGPKGLSGPAGTTLGSGSPLAACSALIEAGGVQVGLGILPVIVVWATGEPQPGAPRSLWLTGLLPQFQRFRQDDQKRVDVALLPDEEEETLQLRRVQDGERRYEKLYVPIHHSLCHPVPAAQLASPSVSPWPQVGLMEELAALAQARGLSLEHCAERYATASLPESQAGWRWNERLGFSKKA